MLISPELPTGSDIEAWVNTHAEGDQIARLVEEKLAQYEMPKDIQQQLKCYVPLTAKLLRDGALVSLSDVFHGVMSRDKLLASRTSTVRFNQDTTKVLWLEGVAGSGKTLAGWYLRHYFVHRSDFGLPMYRTSFVVSLKEFKSVIMSQGDILGEYLRKYQHITDDSSRYNTLRNAANWVVVLDGLDEVGLRQPINLIEDCKLHFWHRCTFVITCRSAVCHKNDIAKFVAPMRGKLWLQANNV